MLQSYVAPSVRWVFHDAPDQDGAAILFRICVRVNIAIRCRYLDISLRELRTVARLLYRYERAFLLHPSGRIGSRVRRVSGVS